jgi:uncharacterized protein
MAFPTVSDSTSKQLLTDLRTIAVVGISTNPGKDSHMVAAYLKKHGYRIIPVNPGADEVLGEKSYPDLRSIPEPVDIVDVFRRPEFLPEIAEQAVAIHAKVLWMQKGISNERAALTAKQGGLTVIEDT